MLYIIKIQKIRQKSGVEKLGSTIDMYIFKNPKLKEESNIIKENFYKEYSNRNIHFNFKCEESKVGYIWIWTYLSPMEFSKDINSIEIEELFFTIYKEFFPNEVAYVNSEKELEGGYQNVFYYESKRHYFATCDNIAYDIKKIFRNYNDIK